MIMNQLNPAMLPATGPCGASMEGVRIKLFCTGEQLFRKIRSRKSDPIRMFRLFFLKGMRRSSTHLLFIKTSCLLAGR
jgi:hypothetical protein